MRRYGAVKRGSFSAISVTRRTCLRALILLLCAGLLAGCASTARGKRLEVVATILPLADWVREVGAERVHVRLIVPQGVDPRTYVPSADQERALRTADVVLLNGLGLEPWIDDILDSARTARTIVLDVSQFTGPLAERIPLSGPRALDEGRAQARSGAGWSQEQQEVPIIRSPYLWLDPRSAMDQVGLIAQTLTRVDPAGLAVYRQNAARYSGELENLDVSIQHVVSAWPRQSLLSNNLFLYPFARHYNLLLQQTGSASSPTTGYAQSLMIDALVPRDKPGETVKRGAREAILNPLGGRTYIELMQTNIQTMTTEMAGQP